MSPIKTSIVIVKRAGRLNESVSVHSGRTPQQLAGINTGCDINCTFSCTINVN